MKIGKYISDLLFENDFVILPEIGEFSTKYIPARFVPELKKVESPSKVISFNDKNKSGGGLLIEYIANKEGIGSEEAKRFVDNFAAEMQNSFKSGKKVELESIGVFSMDQGGTIEFEPDTTINYLSDTAGMSSVAEPARKTEEEAKTELDKVMEEVKADIPAEPVKEVVEEIKEEEKDIPVTPLTHREPVSPVTRRPEPTIIVKKHRSGLSPALKWVAFTVVPLLVIIIILALNYDYILGDKSIIFKRDKTAPKTEVTTTPAPTPSPVEEAAPAAVQTPVQAQFDPTVAPPAPEAGRKVYYIIVGSFEEEHSAIILAEELRIKGARTASVFPVNRQGFYRVSYGYFYDLREAESELANAQRANPNAWILHR